MSGCTGLAPFMNTSSGAVLINPPTALTAGRTSTMRLMIAVEWSKFGAGISNSSPLMIS